MSDTTTSTPTWTVNAEGNRGTRTTSTGSTIEARRRTEETAEAFTDRLRWGRLDELAIDFIADKRDLLAAGTVGQYRSDLNSMILPALGDRWLVDCNAPTWKAFRTDILDTKGPKRFAAAHRTVGAILTWAHEHSRWPTHIPAFGGDKYRKVLARGAKKTADVTVTAGQGTRHRIVLSDCPTIEETWAFADAVGDAAAAKWGEAARAVGDLFKIQYLTGARIGTAFAFRTEDFNLDKQIAFVHHQVDRSRSWPILDGTDPTWLAGFAPPFILNKDKDEDVVEAELWEWAPEELRPILDDADRHRGGWLFATCIPSKRPLDAIEKLMRDVRKTTGYRYTSHWHRHAYASLNLARVSEGGYDRGVATVAAWLGDGVDVVQKTYWHPNTNTQAGWSAKRPKAWR